MKQIEFKKEKIAVFEKIKRELLNDLKTDIGHIDNDFINDQLTAQLTGYIYSNMADERDLIYYCPRPKFFDWLFRRRKKVIFKLKIKDLLINASKPENTERIYIVE